MGKIDMKEIREVDERWLRILFGEPYEAKFQSRGVHVYDGNGDEILTYIVGVGRHKKESKAETEVHGTLKAAYYDAYHAARQEINSGIAGMESGCCAAFAIMEHFDNPEMVCEAYRQSVENLKSYM